jgi:hypothetical protein
MDESRAGMASPEHQPFSRAFSLSCCHARTKAAADEHSARELHQIGMTAKNRDGDELFLF